MIGTKLSNRFEILKELGRGGMGVVYLARDPILEREVAIKLVTPAALTPATHERFRREARVVAKMDHPAIVGLYDVGEHDGSVYIVMPFVPGKNLRAHIKDQSLRIKDVIGIGIQVAEALEYSHVLGVVHRDIKPENIMVSRDPASDEIRVRITDFGLAVPTSESRLTQSGALVGTVGYISPEQLTQGELDGRTDIYSLGTVLYECVVGDTPFPGELLAVLYRITHENPQPPRSLGAEIPEELEAIILRCLEKIPDRRPQRASELAQELNAVRSRIQEDEALRMALDATHRPTVQFRPATSPLIGREQEFAELQRRLNAAGAGECQFAVIGGESGIGKSRLLEELEKLASVRKIRVLHGRFAEQHHTFPYKGFCDLFQEYLRTKTASGSEPLPDFSDLARDLIALFPMLSELEPTRTSQFDAPKGAPAAEVKRFDDRSYIFELLSRTLHRICANKPLVILLEDLHAADVSIEALQYAVHRLISSPLLILATFRNPEVDKSHPLVKMMDTFEGDKRFVLILLEPFSQAEHRRFVETMSGSKVDDRLAEKLFTATDGNPYFTKELYRSLLGSKSITKTRANILRLSGSDLLASQSLPATIQQTVKRRAERLPRDLHQILSIASVLGKTFVFRDLEFLADKKNIEEAVDTLVEEGFVEEELDARGNRLAFSSGMLRDVLYSALPPRKRRSLHRAYAQELEQRSMGRLDRIYPELVYHYSNGDVSEKVVEYGLRLAKKSLAAFSAEDAARAARTVLDFIVGDEAADPTLEAEVRGLLAEANRMGGDIDGSLRELEEVIRILESDSKPAQAVLAILRAVEIAWQGRRFDHTRTWMEKGIPAARLIRDNASLAKFLSIATTVTNLAGEHERAAQYQEELASIVQPSETKESVPRGGRLVVALPAAIHAHHPAGVRVDEEFEIFATAFETLTKTDTQGNLVAAICERWEPLEQGRAFLLSIRGGVQLQDGRILTAQLVRDSLQDTITECSSSTMPAALSAIKGVAEFLAEAAENVAGLKVFSEQKLGIELTTRLPLYPAMLSDVRASIALRSADGKIVGTGPFQIVSQDTQAVVLNRNSNYWRRDLPVLDTLEFRTSLSSKDITAGLRSGIFDVARDILPDELEEVLLDRNLQARLVETAEKNVYFLLFNSSGPAAQDADLRRDLCSAVRVRDLVRMTLGRFAQPATGMLPPGILGHDPGRRRVTPSPEKRPEQIRSGRLKLTAAVHPIFQDRYASLTDSLFQSWSALGIDVSIQTSTMDSFLERNESNADIDLILTRWIADYGDPDNFTYGLFHSEMGFYRKYYCSKDLDRLLESAREEGRPGARATLYHQIESYLLDAGFLLPLFHDIDYRVAGNRVKRLSLRSSPPYVNYEELAKTEEQVKPVVRKRKEGGVITVPIARQLMNLDPSLAFLAVTGEILPNIFETLTRHQAGAEMVPWLASHISAEEGGRQFHFQLQQHVRFHDSRRLTARDVRYTFERMLTNPESKSRWMLLPIRGARALFDGSAETLEGFHIHSDFEFTIDLDQPLSFFPAILSYPGTAILPEGADQFVGGWKEGSVGTGPFRVMRFEPGRLLELEANPYYWRDGFPRCDGLVFTFGVTPAEIIAGFKAGRFSLASDLIPSDVEALRQDPAFAARYRESPRLATEYIIFNIHQGPLKDESLRLQLRQALDVETLVRANLGRMGLPAFGLIPPGMLGNAPAQLPVPAKNRRIPEVELVAAISPRHQGRYAALAHDIFRVFEETGARIRVLNPTESEYAEILISASVDLIVTGWTADYPDADTFAHGVLHSQQGADGRFCGTREIDRLIEKGRTETDPAIRHQIYREIEQILSDRSILLPLFHEQTYRFANNEVEGLEISLFAPTVDYQSLWLHW